MNTTDETVLKGEVNNRAIFIADYRTRHDIPEYIADEMIWKFGPVEDQFAGWNAHAAQAQQGAVGKPGASFHDWWDADRLTQTNPYDEGTPSYWAWEGWQACKASQNQSIAAVALFYPNLDPSDEHTVITTLPEIMGRLQEAYRSGSVAGTSGEDHSREVAVRIMRQWDLPDADTHSSNGVAWDDVEHLFEDYARKLHTVDYWSGKVVDSRIVDAATTARDQLVKLIDDGRSRKHPRPVMKDTAFAILFDDGESTGWVRGPNEYLPSMFWPAERAQSLCINKNYQVRKMRVLAYDITDGDETPAVLKKSTVRKE